MVDSMPKLSRIPTQDFDRDDRFILIGQEDGLLSAIYHKNGMKVFSVKISDVDITAVCYEEQDEDSNQIFYAADSSNNICTVDKKGETISQVQLKARKGRIHTIVLRSIHYTSTLDNWHDNLLARIT